LVPQAILESNNYPEFLDTSSDCFSTRIKNINFSKIDILILSHLLGIPNFDYEEIAYECQKRSIILIDDIAQTYDAEVNGHKIGALSDFALNSFGFDKPMSCFIGASLKIYNDEYIAKLSSLYEQLPVETIQTQKLDLKRLLLYHRLTEPALYDMSLEYGGLLDKLVLYLDWAPDIDSAKIFNDVQRLSIFRKPYHLFRIINDNVFKIKALKMGVLKRSYLNLIRKNYQTELKTRLEATKLAKKTLMNKYDDLIIPEIPDNISCAWLRLPVLVNQSMYSHVINWSHSKGIQAGPFNWPNLCFETIPQFKNHKKMFPESIKICQTIVNFPVWSTEIWNQDIK